MGHKVEIIQSETKELITIKMNGCGEAHKTLGVMAKPMGTMTDETIKRKTKSKNIATNARTAAVTKYEGWTYYHSKWLAAMNYGLEATFLSRNSANQ